MKILLAEDDQDMARGIMALLTRSSYAVDAVDNGKDAFDYVMEGDYDLVILDILMPGLSGIEVLRKLRQGGKKVPVMLLTALGEVEQRVGGLDAGADDYLPKPFDGSELLARVRALLRRSEGYTPDILEFGDLSLDRNSSRLLCRGRGITLNHKSFQVMEMLMVNKGRNISVNEFMEHIWGWDSDAEMNVVWVNISYLRKQLLSLGSKAQIRAIRGVGYTLEVGN